MEDQKQIEGPKKGFFKSSLHAAKSGATSAARAVRVPVTLAAGFGANRGAYTLMTMALMVAPTVIVLPEVVVAGAALAVGMACAMGVDKLQRRYI